MQTNGTVNGRYTNVCLMFTNVRFWGESSCDIENAICYQKTMLNTCVYFTLLFSKTCFGWASNLKQSLRLHLRRQPLETEIEGGRRQGREGSSWNRRLCDAGTEPFNKIVLVMFISLFDLINNETSVIEKRLEK